MIKQIFLYTCDLCGATDETSDKFTGPYFGVTMMIDANRYNWHICPKCYEPDSSPGHEHSAKNLFVRLWDRFIKRKISR